MSGLIEWIAAQFMMDPVTVWVVMMAVMLFVTMAVLCGLTGWLEGRDWVPKILEKSEFDDEF